MHMISSFVSWSDDHTKLQQTYKIQQPMQFGTFIYIVLLLSLSGDICCQ